jgi:hypothetical protein
MPAVTESLLWVAIVLIVAGVACYDWRAGLIAAGVAAGAAGWLLSVYQEP